jgi:hypothetical protein
MLASPYRGITRRGTAIARLEAFSTGQGEVFDRFTPQKPPLTPQFDGFVGYLVLQRSKQKKVAPLYEGSFNF